MLESVPNFSEGRDAGVVEKIANAIAGTPGVALLGFHGVRELLSKIGHLEETDYIDGFGPSDHHTIIEKSQPFTSIAMSPSSLPSS